MTEIEEALKKDILENFEANYDLSLKMKEYLSQEERMIRGRYLKALHIPKIYGKDDIEKFEEIVTITNKICEKIVLEYIENESYRKIFPFFSDKLKELILIPRGYNSVIPIARFDIFYNEETKDFKFCELNTNGTSGARDELMAYEALSMSPTFNDIKNEYKLEKFELFDTLVDSFMDTYRTYYKSVENPYIAIVDFLDKGILKEFELFEQSFKNKGLNIEICEIRDMKYINNELISPSGHKVDAVYMRTVTCDVEKNLDQIKDFIDAAKDENICLLGSFCTEIIHSKWIFVAMWEQETFDILSEEEVNFIKAHVPKTCLLSESKIDLNKVKENKDDYVIKPIDNYGSSGVYVGKIYTKEQWIELIEKNTDKDYLIQEFCQPYKTENIYMPEDKEFKLYSNMPGLFSYNGQFKGVYSRLSDSDIISTDKSLYNKKVAVSLRQLN